METVSANYEARESNWRKPVSPGQIFGPLYTEEKASKFRDVQRELNYVLVSVEDDEPSPLFAGIDFGG